MENSNKRYFVIRVDYGAVDFIWKELQEGRLRQGWGVTGMQLKEQDGRIVDKDTWKKRYKEAALKIWGYSATNEEAEMRYRILNPMIEAKKGDIVIVPKMPDWEHFVIAPVSKEYAFDFQRQPDSEDYRHILYIDPSNIRIFNIHAGDETRVISGKLRGYRSAVNNIWNKGLQNAIEKLFTEQKSGVDSHKEIHEILGDFVLKEILDKVRKYPPVDLEKLVRQVFESNGYELVDKNCFDGQGGDADLVFKKELPIISEMVQQDLLVYIQVKNKVGIDQNDYQAVAQVLKAAKEPESLKIVVSTADDFTDKCKREAQEDGVILINGLQLATLLARSI